MEVQNLYRVTLLLSRVLWYSSKYEEVTEQGHLQIAFLFHIAYHFLFYGSTEVFNLVRKSSYSSSVVIFKNIGFASVVWICGL